jgi:hypothetical protein
LGVDLAVGRWSTELAAGAWLPARAEVTGEQGGEFRLWTISLSGCRSLWRLDLCLGAELGRLSARSYGVRDSRSPDAIWFAGRAASRLAVWRSGPGRLEIGLAAALPIRRDRFAFDNETTLHRPSRASLRTLLSYRFAFSSPD